MVGASRFQKLDVKGTGWSNHHPKLDILMGPDTMVVVPSVPVLSPVLSMTVQCRANRSEPEEKKHGPIAPQKAAQHRRIPVVEMVLSVYCES
jgi:hypothetical protein